MVDRHAVQQMLGAGLTVGEVAPDREESQGRCPVGRSSAIRSGQGTDADASARGSGRRLGRGDPAPAPCGRRPAWREHVLTGSVDNAIGAPKLAHPAISSLHVRGPLWLHGISAYQLKGVLQIGTDEAPGLDQPGPYFVHVGAYQPQRW